MLQLNNKLGLPKDGQERLRQRSSNIQLIKSRFGPHHRVVARSLVADWEIGRLVSKFEAN